MEDRHKRTAGDLAEGQSGGTCVGAESVYQAARKFDGEGHFGIADRDWPLELLCLLEVAIRLTFRDRAIARQSLRRLGPIPVLLQQGTGEFIWKVLAHAQAARLRIGSGITN